MNRNTFCFVTLMMALIGVALYTTPSFAEEQSRPLVLHVKTALSVDDAQICIVPNIAWAALVDGRPVTIVFDGSAVTSITKGYGWRGWFGIESTAMERAALPERERVLLSKQLGVSLETVPHDYGEYLNFLINQGVEVVYNRSMAVLYQIPIGDINPEITAVGLKDLLAILETQGTYLVY